MWDGLISDLISGLKDGLWDDLINDLIKFNSTVCILLVKADFNECKWFKRWF